MASPAKMSLGVLMAKRKLQEQAKNPPNAPEASATADVERRNHPRAYCRELRDFLHTHLGVERYFFADDDNNNDASNEQHAFIASAATAAAKSRGQQPAAADWGGGDQETLLTRWLAPASDANGPHHADSFEVKWNLARLTRAWLLAMVGANVSRLKAAATGKSAPTQPMWRKVYTAIAVVAVLLTLIGNAFNMLAPHLLVMYIVTVAWVPFVASALLRSDKPLHPATLGLCFGAGVNNALANLVFVLFVLTVLFNVLSRWPYVFVPLALAAVGGMAVLDARTFRWWRSIRGASHAPTLAWRSAPCCARLRRTCTARRRCCTTS